MKEDQSSQIKTPKTFQQGLRMLERGEYIKVPTGKFFRFLVWKKNRVSMRTRCILNDPEIGFISVIKVEEK